MECCHIHQVVRVRQDQEPHVMVCCYHSTDSATTCWSKNGALWGQFSDIIMADPLVHYMKAVPSKYTGIKEAFANFSSCLLRKFRNRYANARVSATPALATRLYPHFKDAVSTTPAEKRCAHTLFRKQLKDLKISLTAKMTKLEHPRISFIVDCTWSTNVAQSKRHNSAASKAGPHDASNAQEHGPSSVLDNYAQVWVSLLHNMSNSMP